MRAFGSVILLAVILPEFATAQTVTVTSSSPVEAKLAAVDACSKVVQQTAVRRYERLLDDLDRKCKEGRTQIGDIAVKGVELLAKKRVTMTNLKFLQSMSDSMPEGSQSLNLSCAEIAAILVTMIDRS
jgi:hypothetical protein